MAANEELTPSNRYCIKNLTAGDLLRVRVVAVNPGGRSEPGTLPDPVPIREIVGESPPNCLFSQTTLDNIQAHYSWSSQQLGLAHNRTKKL